MNTDMIEKLEKIRLESGSHEMRERGVCAMEAVAWIAGEPHSDHPQCACPVIAAFVRRLNDQLKDDERQRLKRYIPQLIGSRSTPEVEMMRAYAAADHAVRVLLPMVMRRIKLEAEAASLALLQPVVDRATALAARDEAWQARNDAAAYAAYAADADDADDAAAYAADAYAYAADDADARKPFVDSAFACLERMLAISRSEP